MSSSSTRWNKKNQTGMLPAWSARLSVRIRAPLRLLGTSRTITLGHRKPGLMMMLKQHIMNQSHFDRVALGAISACPALFPCNNALPACNRLGVAQDTSLRRVTPVGSSREERSLVLET